MQLDLFAERRGPAQIVRFPLARRKSLISTTARALASRDHDSGRAYWKAHLRTLRASLKACGYTTREIAAEIEWHTASVSRETIILLNYCEGWPNDAA